jgi:superfamily II DNA or RNA helicase
MRLGVKTLIVVHTEELSKQWYDNIKETLHTTPSRYDGKHKELGTITIGMIQTISRHLKAVINAGFNFVIADEAHRAPSDTYYKTLMRINAYYRLGLTATPTREDHSMPKFVGVLGEVLQDTATAKELMNTGYLAKAKLEFLQAPVAPGGTNWKSWQTAYTMGIVGNRLRNDLIANRAHELLREGKLVYIHVERVIHGKTLERMIEGSKFIEGKSKDRSVTIKDFKDGKLRCLISTLLKEGADIPSMDAIIMAGGGKSAVAVIQKAGRALRVTKDKKEALVIDFIDQGKWLRDHSQERRMILEEKLGGR